MPFFDFECKSCGKVSEILVRLSDGEPPVCDHCGSKDLEKQVAACATFHGDMPGRNLKWDRGGAANLKAYKKEFGLK